MKKLLMLTMLSLLAISFTGSASSNHRTSAKKIDSIRIEGGGDGSNYYYFVNNAGWEPGACPNVTVAFITSGDPAAKEMLTLAMASKANGTPVSFRGECYEDIYFKINYMIQE